MLPDCLQLLIAAIAITSSIDSLIMVGIDDICKIMTFGEILLFKLELFCNKLLKSAHSYYFVLVFMGM